MGYKCSEKPISFWENALFSDESMVIIDLGTVMNRGTINEPSFTLEKPTSS